MHLRQYPSLYPHPYHYPANGRRRTLIRIDRLHDILFRHSHSGPTHHLRISLAILTTPTDHNLNSSTGSSNLFLTLSSSTSRTRSQDRFKRPDLSLHNQTDLRILVLVEMSTCLASSSPGLRTLSVLRIKIYRMRLRSSGLDWNRFVCIKPLSFVSIAKYSCLLTVRR